MLLLKTCLYRFILLICLFGTGYMTYLQFKYYLHNEDLASISYPKFNKEEKDEYPTFSLCFMGFKDKEELFDESHAVFSSNNITRKSYSDYLRGVENDYPVQTIGYPPDPPSPESPLDGVGVAFPLLSFSG